MREHFRTRPFPSPSRFGIRLCFVRPHFPSSNWGHYQRTAKGDSGKPTRISTTVSLSMLMKVAFLPFSCFHELPKKCSTKMSMAASTKMRTQVVRAHLFCFRLSSVRENHRATTKEQQFQIFKRFRISRALQNFCPGTSRLNPGAYVHESKEISAD